MGTKRLTLDYVKEQIEMVDGYKLLSKEYVNCKNKLRIQCDKGHRYKVNWNNFSTGKRCPVCNGGVVLTYKYVKEQIELKGYKNNNTKLLIQCNKGHEYESTWGNLSQGYGCVECYRISQKLTYGYVKDKIESVRGYKILSDLYVDIHTKFTVQCNKNHIYKVSWSTFSNGRRCPVCAKERNGLYCKLTYNHIKEQIESVEGYKLLSTEYENSWTKLKLRCVQLHRYESTYNNFQSGRRCPVCNPKTSKAEIEIQEFVKCITSNVVCNDRTQILNPITNRYLELDIYLPDQNKAIEYNGVYWHSKSDAKINDKIKQDQCKKIGIDLLIVNEDIFLYNKDYILDKIREFVLK